MQISSNSIIFKKNDISKNSIFLSPSICNFFQKSNDVTPFKSPPFENEQSNSDKEINKLKQINIDFIHKNKNLNNSNSNKSNKNININNININSNINNNNINNNNYEIIYKSDKFENTYKDNSKSLSSQRIIGLDTKTPIKYAKNQLQSGERSGKSNNSKCDKNNSNISDYKVINIGNEINKMNSGNPPPPNKNGRNLMNDFEKAANGKENDDYLKFLNNRRQPTEIHLTSEEFKKNEKMKKNLDKLDDDSIFMEKDKIMNNDDEDSFIDKIKNNLKKTEKNFYNTNNITINIDKIQKNIEVLPPNTKEIKDPNNKDVKKNTRKNINSNLNKKDKINCNIFDLTTTIMKELSKIGKKDPKTKTRPSSVTKNISTNYNSQNSMGQDNSQSNTTNVECNNLNQNQGFKTKKAILIKKPKYYNQNKYNINNNNNNNEIGNNKLNKKSLNKNLNNNYQDNKPNNATIDPVSNRKKIKIPNRVTKKQKNVKEMSINNITMNIKDKKRAPSFENHNRRATSFTNFKQTINTNVFQNNNHTTVNNNNIIKKNNSKRSIINSSGNKNSNKNKIKKQKPITTNLFLDEELKKNSTNNNNLDIGSKLIKKRIKPQINLKKEKYSKDNININNIIVTHDRNYQTVTAGSRNPLEIKQKLNNKIEPKELNINNNNNNLHNNLIIKKKDDSKVKIIQNFSSYHKIKYKSHIAEKINFAETQPKQMGGNGGFYNCNKDNKSNEDKIFPNNTFQHKEGISEINFLKYDNSVVKQVKFRKLEKLPGDSDDGDVDLNNVYS